jgi:hypothetical protein
MSSSVDELSTLALPILERSSYIRDQPLAFSRNEPPPKYTHIAKEVDASGEGDYAFVLPPKESPLGGRVGHDGGDGDLDLP